MQESEIADFKKAHELNNFSFTIVVSTMKSLIQELDCLQSELSQELGHVVNGKKIPSKITIYNETIAETILDKVLVDGNTLNYYFKNGIIICREFSNPTPGRQSKNKV